MIGDAKTLVKWLPDQEPTKVWEVKEYHERRSLNANAFAWSLIGKIADHLRASKDEIYLQMLKAYGQSKMISVLAGIPLDGYIKYYEPIGSGTVQGKLFTHYKVYKGSSEYDTREMAIFIDGIISECEQMGIPTLPDSEVRRIKSEWSR